MRRRLLRLFAGCAALLTAVPAVPARAAGGTWGARGYQYVGGVVCHAGAVSSPLASWDFGDGGLDFLADAVRSNGLTDSAALPTQSTPGRFASPVIPGQYGFGSDADIATYAELLARWGRSRPAEVARGVLDRTDPGRVPNCVDAGAAESLVASAAERAGPYTLSLSNATSPAVLGARNAITVHVTGSSGAPAAGVHVELDADADVFGSDATTTVTTGADGTATAPFVAPRGLAAESIGFQAIASVPIGLEAVTVVSGGGQRYATALYADSAQTFTGQRSVPIDATADPHIRLSSSSTAGVEQAPIDLGVVVSGMRGHSGQAQVQVSGPAPLDAKTLCGSGAAASDAVAYTSPLIEVVGDQTVDAGTWTPAHAGCYRVQAKLATSDAVPEARADSGAVTVTVLDSTATFTTQHTVISPGAVSGSLAIAHSHGLGGTATLLVRGPATPHSGDCSSVDWSKQPARTVAGKPVRGDHKYAVRTSAITAPGCYLVAGTVGLPVPGGIARVPIRLASTDGLLYLLHPSLTLTADRIWSESPNPVATHVVVTGTYGQAGTLRVEMLHAPPGSRGCRDVSFAGADADGAGPNVPVKGDGSYAVTSGPTPHNGCYSLVPSVTMTANPAVRAVGRAGAAGSVITAGLPVSDVGLGPHPDPKSLESPSGLALWPTLLGYFLIALAIMGVVLKVANDARNAKRKPTPGLHLLD